jgi:O-antigen/teichoic acid export membrane protein
MIARNAIANAAGMVVTILVQLGLSMGAYRLVGAEQYGLIGLYGTAMTAAAIFDIGLGQTMIREAARRRHLPPSDPGGVRPLTYNFLFLYLALAVFIAGGMALSAPLIARFWLHPEHISAGEITEALTVMGVAIAIQRVRGLYQAVLDGVEKQVVTNGLLIVSNLIRLAFGLGALVFHASALAFFVGQALASLIETSLFAVAAGRALPPSDAPRRFDRDLVVGAGRFALTNAVASAVGMSLQIADSVIISAALPLAVFGNYSLVASMCQVLLRLTQPVLNAAYPRTAAYVREEQQDRLEHLVFAYTQVSTILLATAAFALIFFGGPMLALVSGQAQVGHDFAPVLAILTAAYAFSGFSRCVHVLQMAEGFPGIALKINLVFGVFYLPAIVILTPRYGVAAPASCLLIGNAASFVAFAYLGFRERMKGRMWDWLRVAMAPQLLAIAAVYLLGWALAEADHLKDAILLTGVAVILSGVGLTAGVLVSSDIRTRVRARIAALRSRRAS